MYSIGNRFIRSISTVFTRTNMCICITILVCLTSAICCASGRLHPDTTKAIGFEVAYFILKNSGLVIALFTISIGIIGMIVSLFAHLIIKDLRDVQANARQTMNKLEKESQDAQTMARQMMSQLDERIKKWEEERANVINNMVSITDASMYFMCRLLDDDVRPTIVQYSYLVKLLSPSERHVAQIALLEHGDERIVPFLDFLIQQSPSLRACASEIKEEIAKRVAM